MSIMDVLGRDPSVLEDGTRLQDLFDLARRRVSARVFSDPEIFRLEMSRLFTRSWLFLGVESEIPEPGDFVVRPMGGDSVIVTRDNNGAINVLLNRCTHRGTQLCVTDCGHAQQFRCPYHGWLFATDGRLKAMPNAKDWLGDGNKADYAMRKARVETRGGLIFGTWDADMPDFETYLGEFRFYFDMLFCAVDKDLVTVGAPQRWSVPMNWKLGAENFVGDGYHLQTAHRSLADIGMVPIEDNMVAAVGAEPRWGHGYFAPVYPPDELPPLELTLPWLPPAVLPQLEHHLNPEQMTLLRRGSLPMVVTLFPNMSWLASQFFFFLRTWQPIGPGEIEIRTWVIAHPDATEEERRSRVQGLNLTFGTTGMFETDDTAIWSRIQRSHQSLIGSQEPVSYACSHGASDKRGYLPDGGEWPGPGSVWQGFPSDDPIWNFHMRWLHLMTGGER